ncbi:MAG: NAD-dependent epimerase/dehydratase family protein [Deltaproteobacteria bacterium]|nr:NAD-dependent epimerase/dehydratase family protein [Deltaproteobacteria bacterium]MBW1987290.1 NAD-dependent epimerase/dehydratase family protein [Deltaproteobacteria bacterium]
MAAKLIMVTGGAGFIGSHVVDLLLEQGHRVLVVDDLSTGSRANLNPQAEFHQLDIRRPEVYDLILQTRPAVICHQAAQVSVRNSVADPLYDATINIMGSLNLLQAAIGTRVEKFIFASTGGAIYGEQDYFPADEQHPLRPVCPYGVAKLAVEKYLYYYQQEYGLKYVALRYANVYGPRQDPYGEAGVVAIFAEKMLSGEQAVINGDGLQTRDFVYVKDVARANWLALGADVQGEINIGTGLETDINTLFHYLKEFTAASMEEYHGPPKSGEQRRSVINFGKARAQLGWEPQTPLKEGLAATVEYFRHHSTT